MSSLSSLSVPARTSSRAVRDAKNLLDNPVNQPALYTGEIVEMYLADKKPYLSSRGAVDLRGVRHWKAGAAEELDVDGVKIEGKEMRAE